jgi:hypothetical protein
MYDNSATAIISGTMTAVLGVVLNRGRPRPETSSTADALSAAGGDEVVAGAGGEALAAGSAAQAAPQDMLPVTGGTVELFGLDLTVGVLVGFAVLMLVLGTSLLLTARSAR